MNKTVDPNQKYLDEIDALDGAYSEIESAVSEANKTQRERSVECVSFLLAMATDPSTPRKAQLCAIETILRLGWGMPPLTWRDWLRNPIRSFKRWKRRRAA